MYCSITISRNFSKINKDKQILNNVEINMLNTISKFIKIKKLDVKNVDVNSV